MSGANNGHSTKIGKPDKWMGERDEGIAFGDN